MTSDDDDISFWLFESCTMKGRNKKVVCNEVLEYIKNLIELPCSDPDWNWMNILFNYPWFHSQGFQIMFGPYIYVWVAWFCVYYQYIPNMEVVHAVWVVWYDLTPAQQIYEDIDHPKIRWQLPKLGSQFSTTTKNKIPAKIFVNCQWRRISSISKVKARVR